ncbi:MAG: ABC transporter ATP-binding protein [Nitrospira sp.]|nr:ABC transporter ATP-binding protein [Nitrospira sp.]MDH4304554.1 ABC transporter ATP-binding protein [Nitrospira sp.]MDH5193110.1 ABC transporter ATP-binding protein [Nitrospira sp.]
MTHTVVLPGEVEQQTVIRLVNVEKSFGKQSVLKGVNLEVRRGKVTTVIGPSGGGKSVLLKHMIGLIRPDRGQVLIDGVDITRLDGEALNQVRKHFAMLFQSAALLDSMTVFDNVAFPLREKTLLTELEIQQKVTDMLKAVDLSDMGHKFPAELSGGMKKRTGLARALIMNPDIILFDEPTTGLDPLLATEIHRLIATSQQRFGFTAVVVSHDIPEVFAISDYVAMLWDGVIEEIGLTHEFEQTANVVVRRFLDAAARPETRSI